MNEWGSVESDLVAKMRADLVGWPTLASTNDEADAVELIKGFPAAVVSFGGAATVQRVYSTSSGTRFQALAEATYIVNVFDTTGKDMRSARSGSSGIYESEKLVRVALMGYAPTSLLADSAEFLRWIETGAVTRFTTSGGSGGQRMRSTYVLPQLVSGNLT